MKQEIRALQAAGEEIKEEIKEVKEAMKKETCRDLEKAKISVMELREKSTLSKTASPARVTIPDLMLAQPDTHVGLDSPHVSAPPSQPLIR